MENNMKTLYYVNDLNNLKARVKVLFLQTYKLNDLLMYLVVDEKGNEFSCCSSNIRTSDYYTEKYINSVLKLDPKSFLYYLYTKIYCCEKMIDNNVNPEYYQSEIKILNLQLENYRN